MLLFVLIFCDTRCIWFGFVWCYFDNFYFKSFDCAAEIKLTDLFKMTYHLRLVVRLLNLSPYRHLLFLSFHRMLEIGNYLVIGMILTLSQLNVNSPWSSSSLICEVSRSVRKDELFFSSLNNFFFQNISLTVLVGSIIVISLVAWLRAVGRLRFTFRLMSWGVIVTFRCSSCSFSLCILCWGLYENQ